MLLCAVEGEEGVLDAGEELGLVLELPVAEAGVVGDEEGHEAIEGPVESGGRSAIGEGVDEGQEEVEELVGGVPERELELAFGVLEDVVVVVGYHEGRG